MSDDLHERWPKGTEISAAWRFVPDAELQKQYDESGDDFGKREFAIELMKRDLANRLCRGELVAIGVAMAPALTAELRAVPKHFFLNNESIDWDQSTVRVYDHAFADVRIVGLPGLYAARRGAVPVAPTEGHTEDEPQNDLQNINSEGSAHAQPAKMGRPPVIPYLLIIIEELEADGKLKCTTKLRNSRIADTARQRFPNLFPNETSPAVNTIRKALQAAGYATGRDQKVQKV